MQHMDFFKKLNDGDVSGAFIFHGDEEYIKQAAIRQLIKSIDPISRDLNMQQFRSPLHTEVLEACETLPFFSDRRLILCYEMADAEIVSLLEKSENLPSTTTLVVYYIGKINPRQDNKKAEQSSKKTELHKMIAGRDVLFTEMSEIDALRFIKKRVRMAQKEIGEQAARTLIEMVGTSAQILANELDKAINYSAQQTEITVDTLQQCISVQREYDYMQMLNQLLSGRKKEAFADMKLMQKQDSQYIFMLASAFAKQFKNMFNARILLNEGVKENDIATRLSLSSWYARFALAGAKRMDADRLRSAAAAFSQIQYLQVSGTTNADLALEIAVTKYL
jgi:DNA polymerase-3 subunit delta